MNKSKSKSLIMFSVIIFVLGVTMFAYWSKCIMDGMTLKAIPIASEGIAAILAIITGIGLYRKKSWSLFTGLTLSGLWIYGCVGGINMVVYDLIVSNKLNYESPIGPLTDAIIFILVTAFAVILIFYLWKIRNQLLKN